MNTLPELYKKMSDLTHIKCMECYCLAPNRCCDRIYCDLAEQESRAKGYSLPPRTDHPTLPYMGPTGCILEPHMRPLCTLHTCSMNGMGVLYKKTGSKMFDREIDIEATGKYFELRNRIEEANTISQRDWEMYVEARDRMTVIEMMTEKDAAPFMKEWSSLNRKVGDVHDMYGQDELDPRYQDSLIPCP